jgi:endonuclease YncB( thermonuclease family)
LIRRKNAMDNCKICQKYNGGKTCLYCARVSTRKATSRTRKKGSKGKRALVGLGVFILLVIVVNIAGNGEEYYAYEPVITQYQNELGLTEAVVYRVIDGDTIELSTGERVRFIGIDTPERGEAGFDEATDFVRGLIEGQVVWLEADGNDTDPHGRLRRYIWIEKPTDNTCEQQITNKMLNARLLVYGYAEVMIVGVVRNEVLFRGLENYRQ